MSGCMRQFDRAPTGHIWNYLRTKNKNQRKIMNYRPQEKRRIHQFIEKYVKMNN